GMRTWLLALAMLLGAPASDVVAQRAPEKPAREKPAREKPAREKPAEVPQSCCSVCSKGQACGDSCISKRKTCHKPPGCACNAGSR
ncbi:MAG: hypothetical protein ABIY55_31780, partial [Kofleriaceae bacterium]